MVKIVLATFSLCAACSPNSLAIGVLTNFKYRAEGSQIFSIRCEGAVGQGVVRGVV